MKSLLIIALLALAPVTSTARSTRDMAHRLLDSLTIDEKISLMMDASPAIPRLGIPQFNWWNEALHGVARAGLATVFPQTIGMAATFDDKALYETFSIVSDEARAKFNDFRDADDLRRYHCLAFWTPNVNIFRDPRWGRGQETYGEDPYLTARIGEAVVRGLQGDDPVYLKTLAGAKHFAVHSGPEWNRHSFDARDIDPRDLRETYLPAFKALVDADVAQVMCAYNRYEGEPCCSSKRLLQQILRNEWSYRNIIVTDCWAINDFTNKGAHETHPDAANASSDAVISGTDLECGPAFNNLRQAYADGLIDEATIDSAVIKLLDFRFRLGELGNSPEVPWNSYTAATHLNTPSHVAKSLEMARKSMVLLKNDGILPLSPSQKIMVVGPNADDSVMQWGNYNGTPAHTVTILEGIRQFIPDVPSVRGCALTGGLGEQSVFDHLASGLYARYFNGHGSSRTPRSVAEAMYSTPVALDGGGATVFAPGVSLTDFEAELRGLFIAPEDGDFILTVSTSPGQHKVTLGDLTTEEFAPDGTLSLPFSASRGEKFPLRIDFCHFDGDASLSVDILNARTQPVSYDDADIIVFVGGISPRLEGEEMRVTVPGFRGGDRETIELPRAQRSLIRSLADAGKRIVMVNCSGSAVGLAPEDSVCSAILQAWYPGQAGGQAVAEVLFGAYNPGGRLPVTFYRDDSQLPDFEDYSMAGRTYRYMDAEPLYPFGHGLSYTTFSYGTPRLSSTTLSPGESITVTLPVTNTGTMDGDEVVMAYVKNPADPAGPRKSLRAFSRTHIPAGKTVDVTFELTPDTFTTFDYATSRMLPLPGTYILHLPASSHNITLTP